MNAGAFSNDKVVSAARTIVPILVDCSKEGDNEDLQKKYDVQGYPTILFVDSQGEQIKELDNREAGAVKKEIENIAKKHPGVRPPFWQNSRKGALADGKLAKKPVAVYLATAKIDMAKLSTKLPKDLGDRTKKFLFVFERGTEQALKEWGLEAAPAVVVLDSWAEDPAKSPVARIAFKEDDKPDVLNKALDEALKSLKK